MTGTTQKAMMELMGHKDPTMTLRYTYLSVEYKRQAVQKLPQLNILDAKSPQIPPLEETVKVVGFAK